MYGIYILYTFWVLFFHIEASAKNDAGGLVHDPDLNSE